MHPCMSPGVVGSVDVTHRTALRCTATATTDGDKRCLTYAAVTTDHQLTGRHTLPTEGSYSRGQESMLLSTAVQGSLIHLARTPRYRPLHPGLGHTALQQGSSFCRAAKQASTNLETVVLAVDEVHAIHTRCGHFI